MNRVNAESLRKRPLTGILRSWRFRRRLPLYAMLLPAIVGLALFNYYPLYGIIIAFQNYNPLLGFTKSPFVGLFHFQRMFSLPDTWLIFRNTLVIAIGKIVFGQLSGLSFALLLNEVRVGRYKRLIQTLTYLPHFLSWVIFGSILVDILSVRGIINGFLGLFGLEPFPFLTTASAFQPLMVVTHVWKEFGWGAVLYLAALTSIDPTLYEAAACDGAGRWQRLRHVTLTGISSTIILLAVLSLGRVLNAGFQQILVMYSPIVYRTADILDTYVYRAGLLSFQYSLATAVGLLKSVVALILIVLSFYLADRLANYRIL